MLCDVTLEEARERLGRVADEEHVGFDGFWTPERRPRLGRRLLRLTPGRRDRTQQQAEQRPDGGERGSHEEGRVVAARERLERPVAAAAQAVGARVGDAHEHGEARARRPS